MAWIPASKDLVLKLYSSIIVLFLLALTEVKKKMSANRISYDIIMNLFKYLCETLTSLPG